MTSPNRPRPSGGGGSSAGIRGAILLVVAAVLGIVLLQAFDTDFDLGGVEVGTGTTTPAATSTTTQPVATTTTLAPTREPSEVAVLVANGTEIRGLAGSNTEALQGAGYATLPPTDTTTKPIETSVAQYAEGYQADAQAVAVTLGLDPAAVQPLEAPPVPDPAGANVVVLLGVDHPSVANAPA